MTTAAVFVGQGCCKADTTRVINWGRWGHCACVCVCVKTRERWRRPRDHKLGLIRPSSLLESMKNKEPWNSQWCEAEPHCVINTPPASILSSTFLSIAPSVSFFTFLLPSTALSTPSFPLFSASFRAFLQLLSSVTRCARRKLAIYRAELSRAEALLVKSALVWFLVWGLTRSTSESIEIHRQPCIPDCYM